MQTHPWRGSSISQIQTYEDSPRKWYFQKILKLPQETKDAFTYGNALHGAIERYLGGKELGECFPAGWDSGLDFQQSISIQAMVRQAVEQGIIARLPNAFPPELSFKLALHPSKSLPLVFGKIDYATSDGQIFDHKSVSSRKYAKNGRDLMTDRQMRFYASAMNAQITPKDRPEVWIGRHNNFCKYDQEVWQTEQAVYTEPMLRENLTECTETMFRMAADAQKRNWQEVACPGSCAGKWGGCPFKNICNQSITLEDYCKSVIGQDSTPMANPFADKLNALKAPRVVPTAAPVAPVVQPPPAQAPSEAPAGGPAPWANADCIACSGSGWQSKRPVPCRVCASTAAQRKVPSPHNYEIVVSSAGVPTAVPRGDAINGPVPVEPPVNPAPPEADSTPAEEPAPAPAPAPKPRGRPAGSKNKPKAEETPVVGDTIPPTPAEAPKRWFILSVDNLPIQNQGSAFAGINAIDLTWLIYDGPLGQRIAQEFKIPEYAACPTLKRQDMLVALGPAWIRDNCSSTIIFCSTGISEFRPLIERLASMADLVFRATH